MLLKFLGKDICENRFNLMVQDTLDACIEKDEESTEDLALAFASSLIEDLAQIIDGATEEWIEEKLYV
jgi:hypothetical protein